MNSIALLCEIIAQGGRASSAFHNDNPAFPALIRFKYLTETGVMSSLICTDCDEHHSAPVVFEDGRYGYHCPNEGFVLLERANIQTVHPDVPLLIDRLAEAFDCSKRRGSAIHRKTWRIGAVETDAGEAMLYFHPCLQSEEDTRDLEHALSREVRSHWRLIVTAMGTLHLAGSQAVQLDDLVELDADTGFLSILAEPADLAGVPSKNMGGRPSDHGLALAKVINDRIISGEVLDGVNAEARAVLTAFKAHHPGKPSPSMSTVKRHLAKIQGGS